MSGRIEQQTTWKETHEEAGRRRHSVLSEDRSWAGAAIGFSWALVALAILMMLR